VQPPKKKRKQPAKKMPKPKKLPLEMTDEETNTDVDKERTSLQLGEQKTERAGGQKMKVVGRDSRLSLTRRKQ
jgi:hypothetical protein